MRIVREAKLSRKFVVDFHKTLSKTVPIPAFYLPLLRSVSLRIHWSDVHLVIERHHVRVVVDVQHRRLNVQYVATLHEKSVDIRIAL